MSIAMPPGKKCAVCLTFDFDAISLWSGPARGLTSPTPISRGEFGARVGVWRILRLLDKYGIKSTFFIPGHTADTYPEITREIHKRGHEIAHHGYLHESTANLKYEEELDVLNKGIKSLKAITGENPLGYRSPAWDISHNTIKLLLEHGFIYDSSMMADDFRPYKCRIGDVVSKTEPFKFGKETALIEIPVTWGLDDFPQFEFVTRPRYLFGLSAPSKVYEIWSGDFDYMYNNVQNGVFDLTMHPQVIGRGHRMAMLEKLVQHMQGYPGVWFTRMVDVAKAWKE